MDSARGRLLDILCNYQAMTKCTLIAVFDAYRVKGHDTELLDYNNIHVVYTKEAETADRFIEKICSSTWTKSSCTRCNIRWTRTNYYYWARLPTCISQRILQEITDMEQYIRETYLNKPL